jgi:Rap1a immunity proteins
LILSVVRRLALHLLTVKQVADDLVPTDTCVPCQHAIINEAKAVVGRVAAVSIIFVLILGFGASGSRAQDTEKDNGNKLLDSCGEVVKALDNPNYNADTSKFSWCIGYMRGYNAAMSMQRTASSTTYSEYKTTGFLGVLLPDGVTNGQIAKVIVKWLQDHPQDLHKDADMLTLSILREAFPAPVPAKAARNVQ